MCNQLRLERVSPGPKVAKLAVTLSRGADEVTAAPQMLSLSSWTCELRPDPPSTPGRAGASCGPGAVSWPWGGGFWAPRPAPRVSLRVDLW